MIEVAQEVTKDEARKDKWREIEGFVDNITDRLGLPVDQKIKPVVVGLLANEFLTVSSCEGHVPGRVGDSRGPSVEIESQLVAKLARKLRRFIDVHGSTLGYETYVATNARDENRILSEKKQLEREVNKALNRFKLKLVNLLDEFYSTHPNNSSITRIVLERAAERRFTLCPQASSLIESMEPEKQMAVLTQMQDEMAAFGEFLKMRYLQTT